MDCAIYMPCGFHGGYYYHKKFGAPREARPWIASREREKGGQALEEGGPRKERQDEMILSETRYYIHLKCYPISAQRQVYVWLSLPVS